MRRTLFWLGLTAVLVLGTAVVAIGGGGPKTDPATATFNVTETRHQEKNCTGLDGAYRDVRASFQGPITGSDPRLNGVLEVDGRSLVNVPKQLGTSRGRMKIRNAAGKKTFDGFFLATNSEAGGGVLKGIITGRFPGSGDELVANFTAEFSSPTQANGEFGSTASVGGSSAATLGKDPAVIQRGSCSNRDEGDRGKKDEGGKKGKGGND
jgi:hypothetical protein